MRLQHPHMDMTIEVDAQDMERHLAAGWLRPQAKPDYERHPVQAEPAPDGEPDPESDQT